MTAGVIDLAVAFALVGAVAPMLARAPIVGRRASTLAFLLLPSAYFLLRDALEGKSIGKLLMGVLVYDPARRAPGGILESINRNWPLAVPAIGPTLMAGYVGFELLSGRPRRIGERGSGTLVVSDLAYLEVR